MLINFIDQISQYQALKSNQKNPHGKCLRMETLNILHFFNIYYDYDDTF